jgi:hypothetical protein
VERLGLHDVEVHARRGDETPEQLLVKLKIRRKGKIGMVFASGKAVNLYILKAFCYLKQAVQKR